MAGGNVHLRQGADGGTVEGGPADDQDVPGLDLRIPAGNQLLFAALDHGDPGLGQHLEGPELLVGPGVVFVYLQFQVLDRHLLGIVGEGLHDVRVLVDHPEPAGGKGNQRSLDDDGEEDDEEDDVKQAVRRGSARNRGHDREYDGAGAPQPAPGDQHLLLLGAAEGLHDGKDRGRTADQGQEQGDREPGNGDLGEGGRGRKQAQQEEDQDLHQPGDAVKEVDQRLFSAKGTVAQDNAGQVDAQITVAADQGGKAVAQEGGPEDQDGIKTVLPGVNPVEQPRGGDRHHRSYQDAEGQLLDQHQQHRKDPRFPVHDADDDDGHHVGEGVVAAAFHFQQGSRAVAEVELPGTQDGKDGGGVGRGNHRADQHGRQPGKAQNKVAENARQQGRQHDPGGGEQDGDFRRGLGSVPVGAKAAVKHDQDQGDGTDLFG